MRTRRAYFIIIFLTTIDDISDEYPSNYWELQSTKINDVSVHSNHSEKSLKLKLRQRVPLKTQPSSTDDDLESNSDSEDKNFQCFLAKGNLNSLCTQHSLCMYIVQADRSFFSYFSFNRW